MPLDNEPSDQYLRKLEFQQLHLKVDEGREMMERIKASVRERERVAAFKSYYLPEDYLAFV